MSTIWKYEIPDKTAFSFDIPAGARLLSVQTQHNTGVMWWLVDPAEKKTKRRFEIVGTGWDFDAEGLEFLGTFQLHGGAIVLHLFERGDR